ncbi:DUF885 domain-containing protein [Massilia atriviolacea]|uniref:DUF885 family protein n=1 Tax=Massilia atriviolacea TaxID=2495579 RepID=A0A430HE36_9BURK|nr:DUF885 family protein [Massilia atriviolacea]RSZ55804.1 DUF885 family protein [Massilia atriviolacea]
MRGAMLLAAALGAAGLSTHAGAQPRAALTPPLSHFAIAQQAMPAFIQRYQLDYASLDKLYTVANGTARARQMEDFFTQWRAALDALPFDSYGVEDRIDAVMMRSQIDFELRELAARRQRFAEAEPLVPFARPLIDMAEARRTMQAQDGAASAAVLQGALLAVRKAHDALLAGADIHARKPMASRSVANRAAQVLASTARDLKAWYAYYEGYDPQLTWWVKRPYADLDKAMGEYAASLNERLVGKASARLLNVTGDPIGRDGLLSALQREMIPYTPEELMALAEKELAWGEAELRKASAEMGFGADWHAAMEKVKTTYVAPGEQPAMVRRLAKEAIDYMEANRLVTVPEVARRSWRMDMLSPESQLISPFFLGGDTILVSYPTAEMTHEQKMMSMRGNNPHFSRATVQHELIPGHHLQLFMADRYQPQRRLFDSPFYVEGWAVYWEMLLYERNFAVTPEDRIGMMFWRNHRAARILFSLGFHMGKITPEQAVDMLIQRVGHEPDNARAEVRRSFNGDYPPLYQAGYMVGALQLRELKRELVDGGKMSLLDYHDRILDGGMLPIELVRARLKNEKVARDFRPGWRFYK